VSFIGEMLVADVALSRERRMALTKHCLAFD
jgi:hypothetical protein